MKKPRISDEQWVAIGDELEIVFEQIRVVYSEHCRLGQEAEEYAHGRAQFSLGDRSGDYDLGEAGKFFAAMKQMQERNGFVALDRELNGLDMRLAALVQKITRTPGASAVARRVKKRAAVDPFEGPLLAVGLPASSMRLSSAALN
jgi:hypothetical protein